MDFSFLSDYILFFVPAYFFLVYFIFYLRNKNFLSSDKKPILWSLENLSIRNRTHKLPIVKTGLIIQSFPIFDVRNNRFVMNCTVWYKFNKSLVALENIEKFNFLNAIKISKSMSQLNIVGDDFFVQYQVQVEFFVPLDQHYFPLNDHSIYIVIYNTELTADEVIFHCEHDSIIMGKNIQINDWRFVDSQAEAGFDFLNSNTLKNEIPHPKIIYTVNVKKSGLRKVAQVIFPIVLIFLISSSVMLIGDLTKTSFLSISIGCLTGILAYRYVINNLSPNVGYFTLAEYCYNYCLIIIFFNFLMVLNAKLNNLVSYPILGPTSFIFSTSFLIFYILFLIYYVTPNSKTKMSKNLILENYIDKMKPIDLKKLNKSWCLTKASNKKLTMIEKIKDKLMFHSNTSWKQILKLMRTYQQELLNSQTDIKLEVNQDTKIVLLVNLPLNLENLKEIINELIKQDILNEDLVLKSKKDYIIFHQTVFNEYGDFKAYFAIVLSMLLQNPKQVFLLQDKEIVSHIYKINAEKSNHFIKKNLKSFYSLIENFYNLLPKQILIDCKYLVQIISHSHKKEQEQTYKTKTDYDAIIYNLMKEIRLHNPQNLLIKIPQNGALEWNLNHSHLNSIQLSVLTFPNNNVYLNTYSKSDDEAIFHQEKYNLIYGFKIDESQKPIHLKSEIIIGCSCDLSQSISVYANYIAEGASIKFIEQNQNGGINNKAIKFIVLDDKYNPVLTQENTKKIMSLSKNFPMMLNVIGTATNEILLPNIINKELFNFFPITGAENLRKEEYENMIFFKASYMSEVNTITHDLLINKKSKRIAIFYQNDGFGLSLLEPTIKIFENYDVKWIAEPYQRNNTSTLQSANNIKNFNPDTLIFYSVSIPAISLIHNLSIDMASNLHLYITSPSNFWLINFALRIGLKLNYCLATPPLSQHIEIVNDYINTYKKIPYGFEISSPSFEGFINSSIMCDILGHIEGEINSETISNRLEQMTNYNFKGLTLNYNPKTRELFNHTWLESI